jgi:hypothetical protein
MNVFFLADERVRRPSTDKSIHPLHSKVIDRMSWRQTVEKAGDAPNFTKPLLPLKVKGLFLSFLITFK